MLGKFRTKLLFIPNWNLPEAKKFEHPVPNPQRPSGQCPRPDSESDHVKYKTARRTLQSRSLRFLLTEKTQDLGFLLAEKIQDLIFSGQRVRMAHFLGSWDFQHKFEYPSVQFKHQL